MSILFISGQEIVVVFLFVLLFFGSKSIPDIARMMGKGMREFRKATEDIQREFSESSSGIKDEIKETTKAIDQSMGHIQDDIDKLKKQKF